MIDQGALQDNLSPEAPRVVVRASVNSTNATLLEILVNDAPPLVLIAHEQREGRGRRGRVWQSPKGGGLYLSYAHLSRQPATELGLLSLMVGVSVSRCLPENVMIKWPNDWVVQQPVDSKSEAWAKVGGCLVETRLSNQSPHLVIIGIGLNFNMRHALKQNALPEPEQAFADLPRPDDVNVWTAQLIKQLQQDLADFENKGFEYFSQAWSRRDVLKDQWVDVRQQDASPITGLAVGINASGQLGVRIDDRVEWIAAADVSVRKSETR